MSVQVPVLRPPPRLLDGTLTVDLGGAVDMAAQFIRGRINPQAAPVDLFEDPALSLRWAAFHQARLLGGQVALELEQHRDRLAVTAGQDTDVYRVLLLLRGDDVQAFALGSEARRFDVEELRVLSALLELPALNRWEVMARRLVANEEP